jgi:aspartyl-tRNA(Asn)/glutamyl-tRNA(Gln) amidotransferase subunit C
MKIEEKQTADVAKLACLALSSEEMKQFSEQLSGILTYVEKLETLDLSKVEPTSHVVPLSNVFREDTVRPSLTPEEALRNAPDQEFPFFRVPKIIE